MQVHAPFAAVTTPVAIHPIVVGPLMRKTVSLCVAMPGVGKSTWAQLAAVAIAYEKPDLLGETHNTPLFPGHVILMGAEDPLRIVRAKLSTMVTYHGLGAPIHGTSLVSMVGMKLFKLDENDEVEFIGHEWLEELVDLRKAHDIGLIVIDTLSACLQGINESNAEQMQAVMDHLIEIADATFSCVLIVHHASKVSVSKDESLNLYSARGSSVLPASVRSAFVLSRPNKQETLLANWSPDEARSWVKMEIVKASYTDPSTWKHRWFKFIPIDIPAYDPRDNSAHTMSIGVLESRAFPATGAPQSPVAVFGTASQKWDILKGALKNGSVFGLARAYKGKLVAKDVLGMSEEATDQFLDELIAAGIITIPNGRTREIVWDGVTEPSVLTVIDDVSAIEPEAETEAE